MIYVVSGCTLARLQTLPNKPMSGYLPFALIKRRIHLFRFAGRLRTRHIDSAFFNLPTVGELCARRVGGSLLNSKVVVTWFPRFHITTAAVHSRTGLQLLDVDTLFEHREIDLSE